MNRYVEYESTLELEFFLLLEDSKDVLWYQEQPVKIGYKRRAKDSVYYPDVLIALKDGRKIMAEIKPAFHMALKRNLMKWKALRGYCAERGWGVLVTDGRKAIQQVQQYPIDPGFASEVFNLLEAGVMTWNEYKDLRQRFRKTYRQFPALVLRGKLEWFLNSFSVSLPVAQPCDSD